MGISYKAVVWQGLKQGENVRGTFERLCRERIRWVLSGVHMVGTKTEETRRQGARARGGTIWPRRGVISNTSNSIRAMGYERYKERDREVKRLRSLVRDFEFEARNRRQRRNQDNRERRDDNVGDRNDGESNQSGSCQRRDRSRESHRRRTRSHSRGPH